MLPFSPNSKYDKDDFTESQELLNLIMSWDKSLRSNDNYEEPEVVQIKFSDDLSNYIRIGVDPTERYSQPPTRKEKIGFALVYVFLFSIFLVGLLGGGVGRKLFEELVRLVQGG